MITAPAARRVFLKPLIPFAGRYYYYYHLLLCLYLGRTTASLSRIAKVLRTAFGTDGILPTCYIFLFLLHALVI